MSRQDFSQIQQFYRPTNVGVYDPQSNPAQDFFGGFKQGQEIVDRQEITRQRQLQICKRQCRRNQVAVPGGSTPFRHA